LKFKFVPLGLFHDLR